MNSHIDAKRGQGIGEVIAKLHPAPLEELQKMSPQCAGQMGRLLEKYELLVSLDLSGSTEADEVLRKTLQRHITEFLTPAALDIFLTLTIPYENESEYAYITSEFLEQLVQNSYNNGHNDFLFHTCNLTQELPGFPSNLKGTKDNPLRITVIGNTGEALGDDYYVHLTLKGNTESGFGGNSQHSVYIVNGEINDVNSLAYNSSFCSYKTPVEETLQKFIKKVPKWQDNTIYRINPDGTEMLVRKG